MQLFFMRKISLIIGCLSVFLINCSKDNNNPGGSSYNHDRNVGTSANDLLSSSKYSSIKLEIQYMPGFLLDSAAIDHLANLLNSKLDKPGGIIVVQKQILSSGNNTLSANDVVNLEKQNRTVYTAGNQLGVYLLVTDGAYVDNNVLGIAYRNTSMCLFGKTIHDNSGAVGQASRTKLEATVMEHEFGHILGLVDLGSTMQVNHEDVSHGAHCDNNNCLMYYAAETTDILGFLITGNIPSLDANCTNDLKTNGGK